MPNGEVRTTGTGPRPRSEPHEEADGHAGASQPMLRIRGLTKEYPPAPWWLKMMVRTASPRAVRAVQDVDLAVERGEIVGLVGPNGAGKTTIIKTVCGLLEPTAGSVHVDGHDVVRRPLAAKRSLGLVLADDRGLYWRLDGRSNLEFFGALAGLSREHARARADLLLADSGLADRDRLVFGYSSGMRTRLSIARALLAEPPFLLLDEPTRSLDPVASVEVNGYLRRLADDGMAVLLSSHRLDEVSAICDRVVVLVGGTVRYEGQVRGDPDSARRISEVLTRETRRP